MEKAQVDPSGLQPIGKVAALNIARSLNLEDSNAPAIEHAIRDEITAMSSHFTLAIADVQTQYEVDLRLIKSVFTYTDANQGKVALVLGVVLIVGFLSGLVTGILV